MAVVVVDKVSTVDEVDEVVTGAIEGEKEDIAGAVVIEAIGEAMVSTVDVVEVGPEGVVVGVGMVSPEPPHEVACSTKNGGCLPALPARTRYLQKIFGMEKGDRILGLKR